METGVRGEAGLLVQRRVLEEHGHDIDLVKIQHQIMAVLLAQVWTMKRHHALQLSGEGGGGGT